jgi:hypothetical protein
VPQTRAREVRAFSVASFALQIMTTDPFASSLASLILSWIFAIPMLAGAIGVVFSVFKKHEDVPWLFSAWMGLCFLIFGPIRYLFFLVTMASSYIFQGWLAFLTVFATGLFVTGPLAFGLLYAVGVGLPLLSVLWILGCKREPTRLRFCVSAIAAPIIALLSSILFSLILPFLAIVTHGLPADYVIRATNGPAYYVFACTVPRGLVALPPYVSETPQTTADILRSHVALLYLSDEKHVYFLQAEYPNLYEEFKARVSKL